MNVSLILKLAFQVSIYTSWKERNARPASVIIAYIQQTLRYRLDPELDLNGLFISPPVLGVPKHGYRQRPYH